MLSSAKIQQNKDRFISLLRQTDKEPANLDSLISFLESSDFFRAPSSARYHGNYEGGLCEHSLNVYDVAVKLTQDMDIYAGAHLPEDERTNERGQEKFTESTIIISTLLHDVCKTNLYKPAEKWYKNEENRWCSYQGYNKEQSFPYGHGELSVEILRSFIKLNRAEMLAIRWHMGFFDPGVLFPGETKFAFDAAIKVCPLVPVVLSADYLASQILEPVYDPTKPIIKPESTSLVE